jgi:aryl-alcohol dehydrogenase-like predicted oxidoreductase
LLNYPEIFEASESLRKAGKARHLGVSAHNDPAGILKAAAKAGHYSVAMVAYSIINHGYVDAALERAHAAGVGVIAMKAARPVFNGRGRTDDPARVRRIEEAVPGAVKRPVKAYLWALRNPRLSAVISEMENAEMVRENVALVKRAPGAAA